MNESDKNLPFITRPMLDFEQGTRFDLEIVITGLGTNPLFVTGATRQAVFTYSVTPTGNIDQESFYRGIGDIPIFLSVSDPSLNYHHGDEWVDVYLRADQVRILKLCSGYVSGQRALSWPSSSGNNPWQETPPPTPYASSNPVAGTDQSDAVFSSQHWIVHGYAFRLVTDATVANRQVHLRIKDNGGVLLHDFVATGQQTASQTRDYVFSPIGAVPTELVDGIFHIPIPQNLVVPATCSIGTVVTNIQATDQISNTRIMQSFMAMDI